MKNIVYSILLATALFASFISAAETVKNVSADDCCAAVIPGFQEEKSSGAEENFANMGRGIVNIGTCFLEVFRCMIYRNAEAPFWGFISGAVEGSGLTVIRAFTGVTDILFLGFEPGNIFEPRFSEYVWDSPWLPKKELQFQSPVLKQD